jgi:calcineurin-like phosphoesterase family protein
MNKLLKFSEKEGESIRFVSDFHAFHNREFVWEARGYSSIREHNKALADKTNEFVGKDDILFNLGDMFLNADEAMVEDYLSQINCQNIYYLWGNHESVLNRVFKKMNTPDYEKYPTRYKNLVFLGNYQEIAIGSQMIVLSHFPLLSWNHMRHNSFCLVGHEHGQVASLLPEANEGKILDVGWDVVKKPVSFAEVCEIMESKSVAEVGHH